MSKEELIEQLKQYIKLCESKDSCNDCIIAELFGECIFTEPPDLWPLPSPSEGRFPVLSRHRRL